MIWWHYHTGRSGILWWHKCNTMLLQEDVDLLDQNHQILQFIFVTEICNKCVDFKQVNHRLQQNK